MASGKAIILGAVITGTCGVFATLLNGHLDRRSSPIQTSSSDITLAIPSEQLPHDETITSAPSSISNTYVDGSRSVEMSIETDKPIQHQGQTTNVEIQPSRENLETPLSSQVLEFEDRDFIKLCDTMFKVDIQKSGLSTSGVVVLSSGEKKHKLRSTSKWLRVEDFCNIRLIETGRNPNYFTKIEVRNEN